MSTRSSRSASPTEDISNATSPKTREKETAKEAKPEDKSSDKPKEKDQVPIHCLPILWGSYTAMDFSQFRETGELSDVTVAVDGSDFHLHKFPLYIKSDFFKAFASKKSGDQDKDRIHLTDFPGGPEIFRVVANYCYNIKIDIRRDNVCKVRCAAEFLEMTSNGNLADLADRYLQDTLTSAKLARSLGTIVDLLLQCNELGTIAEQAGLVDRCIHGIVDCWLMSSKLRPRTTAGSKNTPAADGLQKLTDLPLSWFLQLLVTARDKVVRPAVLTSLAQMYIDKAMEKISKNNDGTEATDQTEEGEATTDEETDSEEKSDDKDGYKVKPVKKKKEVETPSPNTEKADAEIGEILDTLLLELPESAPLADTISPQWAAKMLQTAQSMGCKCRPLLLKLAGRLLPKLTPADLHEMSPSLLCEMVQQVGSIEGSPNPLVDNLGTAVDSYLLELAEKQELTVDVLCQLVSALPPEKRSSHDMLYKVVQTLLKSETLNLEEDDKQKLLDLIDFNKLSEDALQKAYESDIFPTNLITKAALTLCSTLRSELDNAKEVIKTQETELSKFGLGGRGSMWLKNHDPEPRSKPTPSREYFLDSKPSGEYTSSTAAALASAEFDYNLSLRNFDHDFPSYHTPSTVYTESPRSYQPGQYRSPVFHHGDLESYLEPKDYHYTTSSTPRPTGLDYYRRNHGSSRWYSGRH